MIREIYAYVSVSHRVRNLIRAFVESSLLALQTHFPEPATRSLEALCRGLVDLPALDPEALDEDMVRDAIDAIADKFGPVTRMADSSCPASCLLVPCQLTWFCFWFAH